MTSRATELCTGLAFLVGLTVGYAAAANHLYPAPPSLTASPAAPTDLDPPPPGTGTPARRLTLHAPPMPVEAPVIAPAAP